MTLYRAQVMDTPEDPFRGGALRADADAGLLVVDGMIAGRGPYAEVRREHPGETVVDLRPGLLLPGFVDTHVHYPQMRAIGALGMPLLEWLDRCALPEEARLAEVGVRQGGRGRVRRLAGRRGHHDRAGVRLALRASGRPALREGHRARPPDHLRPRRR